MSKEERTVVPFEEAEKMLPDGDRVHTFRQAGPMLIGADWDKEELLEHIKDFEILETGPAARGMNHGIAIIDKNGPLFIATKREGE